MRQPDPSAMALSTGDQIRPWQPSDSAVGSRKAATGNMELQLMNEIKERSEGRLLLKSASDKESPSGSHPAAQQLVTELFESIKAKGGESSNNKKQSPLHEKESSSASSNNKHEIDFKANLRKVSKSGGGSQNAKEDISSSSGGNIDFKSNLKKTSISTNPDLNNSNNNGNSRDHELNQKAKDATKIESGGIVDFKAKLKKPKTMVQGTNESSSSACLLYTSPSPRD